MLSNYDIEDVFENFSVLPDKLPPRASVRALCPLPGVFGFIPAREREREEREREKREREERERERETSRCEQVCRDTHVSMSVCMYVNTYVCMYIRMYIRMNV